MQLNIVHETTYAYDNPIRYGLQQLRLTPKSRPGQEVADWSIELDGATRQAQFEDHNANTVLLTLIEPGTTEITIKCSGTIINSEGSGILGKHGGYSPLWYFRRTTPLTGPGDSVARLCNETAGDDPLAKLHDLSKRIREAVTWKTGETDPDTTAEGALKRGAGVCQDHAHIFVACARELGHPARYVSGYLMMNDRVEQDATHAWAEAHLEGLGWVGFDVSNGISPDERYVRVATGLDYREAAPVSGLRIDSTGGGAETMNVMIQVQQ